jgi:hypothetical protein
MIAVGASFPRSRRRASGGGSASMFLHFGLLHLALNMVCHGRAASSTLFGRAVSIACRRARRRCASLAPVG